MKTAYSVQPLARHILPVNDAPQPTMTMAEYAARENRAATRDQIYKPGHNRDREALGRLIYEYVRANPRCYVSHIVNDLGRKPRAIYNAIADARLCAARDGYIWKTADEQRARKSRRYYWLEAAK